MGAGRRWADWSGYSGNLTARLGRGTTAGGDGGESPAQSKAIWMFYGPSGAADVAMAVMVPISGNTANTASAQGTDLSQRSATGPVCPVYSINLMCTTGSGAMGRPICRSRRTKRAWLRLAPWDVFPRSNR
jgi:hypothetical protein